MKKGFTLLEMLTVLALIGLIAAIAVPNIPSVTSDVKKTQNLALAKLIVATHQWGMVAGVEWEGSSKEEVVADVLKGRASTDGALKGKFFGLIDPSGNALSTEVLDLIKLHPDKQMSVSKR